MSVTTKICIKCNSEKPSCMFSKSRREKDGFSYYCKECKSLKAKDSYKNNCEKIKTASMDRYVKNREDILTRNKTKREANKENHLLKKRTDYLKHREKILVEMRVYYSLNKAKWTLVDNNWKKNNKNRANIITQNYRSRKKNRGQLSKDIASKLFALQKSRCACCGLPLGNDFHIDHITPLYLGGMNIDTNVQLLRKSCNLRKGHKHPIDYMQSVGMLL